jgi:hypothetical protein
MTLPKPLLDAYLQMFKDIEANLFVTLSSYPGCAVSDETMLKRLKDMDAYVARRTLGRRWSTKPDSMRMQGAFILEHGKDRVHPHWHGLLNVPDDQISRYMGLIKLKWAGDHNWNVFFEFPENIETGNGWYRYILKEINTESTSQAVFTNMLRK